MFTIRHVEADGHEELFAAKKVSLLKCTDGSYLSICGADPRVDSLTYGKAWVMNDAGRTVATYDMDDLNGRGQTGTPLPDPRPAA